MNSQSLTTLVMLKRYMNISDTNIDTLLGNFIDIASKMIQTYTCRILRLKTHTEYYDGKLRSKLFLNNYPIRSITTIHDDTDREFGDTSLIDSTYYSYDADTGIVYLHTGKFYFYDGIKNVKIVYPAGFQEFEIIAGYNDAIDFNEGGAEFNATLTAGTYTADDLCTEIKTQLEAEGTADVYTVTYNKITGKYTIVKSAGTFQILWLTGKNTLTSVGVTIGYIITIDDTLALTYTSDNPVLGIPEDLEIACMIIVNDLYLQSTEGGQRQGRATKSNTQGFSDSFIDAEIPLRARAILDLYKRIMV